jgi:hypothetical protein
MPSEVEGEDQKTMAEAMASGEGMSMMLHSKRETAPTLLHY